MAIGKGPGFTAYDKQKVRLEERKTSRQLVKTILGSEFTINPGVYDTGLDTELMIEKAQVLDSETVLEIGSGSGAVILSLADKAKAGLGVDINPLAVKNSQENAQKLGITNIVFTESDLFENVGDTYNVIIWNPPYNAYPASDKVEMMFWDHENAMKKRFFKEVSHYLKPSGRIYFGWADFADIDRSLPYHLATANGFRLRNEWLRSHPSGSYNFIVLEFSKSQ